MGAYAPWTPLKSKFFALFFYVHVPKRFNPPKSWRKIFFQFLLLQIVFDGKLFWNVLKCSQLLNFLLLIVLTCFKNIFVKGRVRGRQKIPSLAYLIYLDSPLTYASRPKLQIIGIYIFYYLSFWTSFCRRPWWWTLYFSRTLMSFTQKLTFCDDTFLWFTHNSIIFHKRIKKIIEISSL